MKKLILKEIDRLLSLDEDTTNFKEELEKLKTKLQLLDDEFIPPSKTNKNQNTFDVLNIGLRVAEIASRFLDLF